MLFIKVSSSVFSLLSSTSLSTVWLYCMAILGLSLLGTRESAWCSWLTPGVWSSLQEYLTVYSELFSVSESRVDFFVNTEIIESLISNLVFLLMELVVSFLGVNFQKLSSIVIFSSIKSFIMILNFAGYA